MNTCPESLDSISSRTQRAKEPSECLFPLGAQRLDFVPRQYNPEGESTHLFWLYQVKIWIITLVVPDGIATLALY